MATQKPKDNDLIAPDGSQCSSCTAFDGGRCRTFLNVASALEQEIPFISFCPDYSPSEEKN